MSGGSAGGATSSGAGGGGGGLGRPAPTDAAFGGLSAAGGSSCGVAAGAGAGAGAGSGGGSIGGDGGGGSGAGPMAQQPVDDVVGGHELDVVDLSSLPPLVDAGPVGAAGGGSGWETEHRVFKCPQCDYKTKKKWNLVAHERAHSGDKPFKCAHCDFRGTEKSTVTKHTRIHTGDKPYICDKCDYRSRHKSTLKTHMLQHEGVKPFKVGLRERHGGWGVMPAPSVSCRS